MVPSRKLTRQTLNQMVKYYGAQASCLHYGPQASSLHWIDTYHFGTKCIQKLKYRMNSPTVCQHAMNDWLENTDGELVELMISGDERAFGEIYKRKQPGIFRFAVHMSGSKTLAEDATQEVFLALIECAKTFDPERGSFSAFLFGIARKQILRLLEKRSYIAQREAEEILNVQEIPISANDPLNDILRGKTIGMVRTAILSLPRKYREVVVLCDLHEFSYEETASMIHTRIGTVRSRLHRARHLLMRKLLEDENKEHASKDPAGGKSYELSTL